MSADTVDDLHAAEDAWGTCVEFITRMAQQLSPEAEAEARMLIEDHDTYCRPTCGAEGDPNSEECTDDSCGCPCGHTDADDS